MAPEGILLLDKPTGFTSHDAVAKARRLLNTRAIGHAGTLDPLATGLLILLVGNATRLNEYVLGHDKAYDAVLKLGERTNTDDSEGIVTATRDVPADAEDQLRASLPRFIGEISQVPPQFSAIKKDGIRAYASARAGETVELAARNVRIDTLTLGEVALPSAVLHISCGSGTYIRALARDLGEAIGCGAHLSALRRTRIGPFLVQHACTPEAIAPDKLFPADQAVMHLPEVRLSEAQTARYLQGMFVTMPVPDIAPGQRFMRVYDARDGFIGIGAWLPERGALKPEKTFARAS